MTESLSLFTVFSALDETYVTDIGVPIDRQFRPMPSYKRQQRPTPQEIDAYLQGLERELRQGRVPTSPRQVPVQIETRHSDLLWLLCIMGIGFFVWLLWTMAT